MAWKTGWGARVAVAIDKTNIGEDLTHFPVRLSLGTSVGQGNDDVRFIFNDATFGVGSSFAKIAVTKPDGTTDLYVEKEDWDSVSEEAELWVSRSGWVIDVSVAESIYLYFDKTHADNTTYVGDIGSTPAHSVWDSSFDIVYHMVDLTSSTVADSTANNDDATKNLGADSPVEAAAHIHLGQEFDATANQYLDGFNYSAIGYSLAFTVECIAKFDGITNRQILFQSYESGGGMAMSMGYRPSSEAADYGLGSRGYQFNTPVALWAEGEQGFTDTASFHHLAVASPASSKATTTVFYKDGAAKSDTVNTGTASVFGVHGHIGANTSGGNAHDGKIDEFRISSTLRSSLWINSTYYTCFDDMMTWGSMDTGAVEFIAAIGADATLTTILKPDRGLVSAITSSASLTAALRSTFKLVAGITSDATLTSGFNATFGVASSISSTADLTTIVSPLRGLIASIASDSSLDCSIIAGKLLFASISATSTLTADLVGTFKLASSITSDATLLAIIRKGFELAASITSDVTLTADLSTTKKFIAAIESASSLAAVLQIGKFLVASISADATLTTDLIALKKFVSSIEAIATLTANVEISIFLAAAISAGATLAAALRYTAVLVAAISADAALVANVTGSVPLIAAISAGATLSAAMTIEAALAAAIDAPADLTAGLGGLFRFVSSIESASTLTATLKKTASFSVTIEAQAELDCRLIERIVAEMVYSGDILAGQTVIIDGINNTITIMGANMRENFNGVFPLLLPGVNTIIYEDSEGSRTIRIRVEKEDRST